VTLVASIPYLVDRCNPSVPARSFRELDSRSRKRRNVPESGSRRPARHRVRHRIFAFELCRVDGRACELSSTFPYKSGSPAYHQLNLFRLAARAAHVSANMVNSIAARPNEPLCCARSRNHRSGRRSSLAPEATDGRRNQGCRAYQAALWFTEWLLPARTPEEIVNRLIARSLAILDSPIFVAKAAAAGLN
jgi:hypothetical protein